MVLLRASQRESIEPKHLTMQVEEDEIDFARLAEPYRAMFDGAPDLSVREGYGNRDNR